MKEIKADVIITPEELKQLDKSKISYMTMQDGVIYKINEESKNNSNIQQKQQIKQEKNLQKIRNDYSSYSNMYINDPFFYNNSNYSCNIYSPKKRSYGRLIADKGNIMIYESGIETINGKYNNLRRNKNKSFDCVVGDEEFVDKEETINIENVKNEKNNSRNEKKNIRSISQNLKKENNDFISINNEDIGSVYYRNKDDACPIFPFNNCIKRKYICGKYVPPRKIKYNYQFVYPNDLGSFNVSKDRNSLYDYEYVY